MIQTQSLTKKYGKFTAVQGLNLHISRGEIYGFLGPNGAGKTSTIMMLLGISRPTSGEIFLFNEKYIPDRLDLRKRIGVVPEKHPTGMWIWMTGYEYLSLFADLFSVKNAAKRIDHLLEYVDLLQVKNKRISEYSRGMLQKLSVIRALLHDPDILFLDEPISGLDPIGIKQIRDLIVEEKREGRTIFISSHLLSEMEKVCDRVAIMHHGKLITEDNMEVFLSALAKDREFLIELETVPSDLITKIQNIPYVLEASVQDTTLNIKVSRQGDYRKNLSTFLIEQHVIPLRIEEKSLSLEEAFVTITQENIEIFTGIGDID
jgi:ABC-2 type transport system ATP-binding protein